MRAKPCSGALPAVRLPRGCERGCEHRGGARRDCAGRRRGSPAGEPRTSSAAPIGVAAGIPRLQAREDVKLTMLRSRAPPVATFRHMRIATGATRHSMKGSLKAQPAASLADAIGVGRRSSRGRTALSSPATWLTPGIRTSTRRCGPSCGDARYPCTSWRAITTTRPPSSPGSATRSTWATACPPRTRRSTRRPPSWSPTPGSTAARPGTSARTSSPGSTAPSARGRTCPPSSACITRRCRWGIPFLDGTSCVTHSVAVSHAAVRAF